VISRICGNSPLRHSILKRGVCADSGVPSAECGVGALQNRVNSAERHGTFPGRTALERAVWLAIDARGGMTINEALAVGLVVNLGNNDRELVFNAGLQLDDKTVDCYSGTSINK
jgi:hypothetical protein